MTDPEFPSPPPASLVRPDAVLGMPVTHREVAANASTNRHDFLVSLDQALKRKAAGVETDRPVSEMAPKPPKPGNEPMPGLRIAGQDG